MTKVSFLEGRLDTSMVAESSDKKNIFFFSFIFWLFCFAFSFFNFYILLYYSFLSYFFNFHFLIFLNTFFSFVHFFHFISFRFLKWIQIKTTCPIADIAPKTNHDGRFHIVTHSCTASFSIKNVFMKVKSFFFISRTKQSFAKTCFWKYVQN